MDKIVFLPAVLLGGVFLVIYLLRCRRQKHEPNIAIIIHLFLEAQGIVGGVLVCANTLFPELLDDKDAIRWFIFLGGMSVAFLAGKGLWSSLNSFGTQKE